MLIVRVSMSTKSGSDARLGFHRAEAIALVERQLVGRIDERLIGAQIVHRGRIVISVRHEKIEPLKARADVQLLQV